MKYLCLVYAEEKRIAALSDSEWDALVVENLELCEELRKSGHYVSASPLDSVQTAATVACETGSYPPPTAPLPKQRSSSAGITSSRRVI